MKICIVHNRYRERGGEDVVAESEAALLRAAGHPVVEYRRDNAELDGQATGAGFSPALRAGAEALWSRRTRSELGLLLAHERPDVIHLHNAWPLISASVCAAAADAGIPLVATLHNYRHLCPQAMFLRDGRPCEDCLGRAPWPALRHGCWRGSRVQTAVLVAANLLHRGTWARGVARWIALTQFARGKFIAGGFDPAQIDVLPNFAEDPGPLPDTQAPRQGLLFVGRLAPEKGIALLAEVLRAAPELHVEVVGSGPAAPLLDGLPNVHRRGALDAAGVRAAMRRARALLLPSQWYESAPRVLVEAQALGLPVIASELGALPELLGTPPAGWLVPAGDVSAWLATMRRVAGDPSAEAEVVLRGSLARRRYEATGAPAVHLDALLTVYDRARATSGRSRPVPGT